MFMKLYSYERILILFKKKKTCTVFLSSFSRNLLVFYHKSRALIEYATHYLFCDR